MLSRTQTTAAAAVAALSVLLPTAASAATTTTENLSRRTYDSAPERTAGTWRIDGATAGPLGGYLDVTATAADGTLPTAPGACEAVDVTAVLTVSPGEVLTVETSNGEACIHQFGGTLSLNAYFGKQDLTYAGSEHSKVKVVGDGLLGAGQLFTGAQATFDAMLRW